MRFPFCCGIALMMLLSSCALFQHTPALLPGDVPMNHDAGRGGLLFVTIQLENGEALPFVLDTGAPITLLDKSLEPKLGKSHRSEPLTLLDGSKLDATVYRAPKLYLRDVRLVTGGSVAVVDLRKFSSEAGRPLMGIIGMDTLKHYCIQLDFKSNQIHFLDDWLPDRRGWGRFFDLQSKDGAEYINGNLVGTFVPDSIIDTGFLFDGWLQPDVYRRWADNSKPPKKGHAQYPNAILGGEIYTNVVLSKTTIGLPFVRIPFVPFALALEYNGIGLHFLARNLVTLDFPREEMFLNQTSVGPLEDEESKAVANAEGKLAAAFLRDLKEKGKLPGWAKEDQWPSHDLTFHYYFPETFAMDGIQKTGDPNTYHYVIFRPDKGAPWQLIDAWQSDAKGKVINRYPLKEPIK